MSKHKKKPRRASGGAFIFCIPGREGASLTLFLLTLYGFKARIAFTNHINPAFTADNTAIRMTIFGGT